MNATFCWHSGAAVFDSEPSTIAGKMISMAAKDCKASWVKLLDA